MNADYLRKPRLADQVIYLPLCACIMLAAIASPSTADDWPMYRKDAGRTGVAAAIQENSEWRLTWSRKLSQLDPAYHSSRLQFDAGYEPVVSQGRLFVASSQTDSVTAFEVISGKQLWEFTTNGPVRLAPAIWKDSICFGSDDGYFYCADVATGKLRWKHRAVPSSRKLLGNRRLISVWPIRGGPVVADGKVYFAAGVWPFEGVFVYSMDIETGKVVWRNDRMGYLFGQQPHNTEAIGGLAPQGYLVINGDELVVPCSTAYPARLNRHTGELIEFKLPSAGRLPGGWFAALDPDTSRALRRGTLTFDDVVNRQQHEDKVHKGPGGVTGLSREIRLGELVLKFDDGFKQIKEELHSMAFADNHLFVVDKLGRIYCYERSSIPPGVISIWETPREDFETTSAAIEHAEELVALASSPHGIALVIGLEDGALVKALLKESWYQVIGIDDDADRVAKLREELVAAEMYGKRSAVIHSELDDELPPYLATVLTTERSDIDLSPMLTTLRPYGGVARIGAVSAATLEKLEPGNFFETEESGTTIVRRVGALPGSTDYTGDWAASPDDLVRFPLGVVWFDDTLAHFKRSPQPKFVEGVMISRPKDWQAPRGKDNKKDYPLLDPVLSDIYTGRVLDATEMDELRAGLKKTDPKTREPSQYRPPRQKNDWKPDQPVVGQRTSPLTGAHEPRSFPKTYGCDGGVDYGSFFTLRSGTAAYYDKTIESGTVFLSGPRSGCTNSIIPAGGLLNVPYFYEGCTCSYPLPTAMSLVAMPESFEQWSSWGATEIAPGTIQRVGVNFGAPGDRITRSGTLWLDYPSKGGPSPKITGVAQPAKVNYHYQHSVWMHNVDPHPWVTASMAEGLEQFVLKDLKPGQYTVRLFFAEPESIKAGARVQTIKLQGQPRLVDFDIASEAGEPMTGVVRAFGEVAIDGDFRLEIAASQGKTLISGIELIRKE